MLCRRVDIVCLADVLGNYKVAVIDLLGGYSLSLLHAMPRGVVARIEVGDLNNDEGKSLIAKVVSPKLDHLDEHFVVEAALTLRGVALALIPNDSLVIQGARLRKCEIIERGYTVPLRIERAVVIPMELAVRDIEGKLCKRFLGHPALNYRCALIASDKTDRSAVSLVKIARKEISYARKMRSGVLGALHPAVVCRKTLVFLESVGKEASNVVALVYLAVRLSLVQFELHVALSCDQKYIAEGYVAYCLGVLSVACRDVAHGAVILCGELNAPLAVLCGGGKQESSECYSELSLADSAHAHRLLSLQNCAV